MLLSEVAQGSPFLKIIFISSIFCLNGFPLIISGVYLNILQMTISLSFSTLVTISVGVVTSNIKLYHFQQFKIRPLSGNLKSGT